MNSNIPTSNLQDFKYLMHGGYANIYYNSKTLTILKVQPLYELTQQLCTSSLYETAFFNTLLNIPNSCHIKNFKIDDNHVYNYMPYYGKPLHEFVNLKKKNISIYVLPIILSIIEKCILLYERGIQHTDLKPNNIIINDINANVTLIDYNICSIRTAGKTKYGWSYGIGTWCYCSPEIVYYDEPCDTSMVWSIGLILAYMFNGHPLSTKDKNIYEYTEQNDWKTIYHNLRKKNVNGLPLYKEHKSLMPVRIQYLYNCCTLWDWKKRPSLYELYESTLKLLYNDFSYSMTISKISYILNKNHVYKSGIKVITACSNFDNRTKAYRDIWYICSTTKRYDILCKSLLLIDKYPDEITQYSIIGCIFVAYILMGSLLTDKSFVNEMKSYFTITNETINNIILDTFNKFKWNCYYETADVLIIDYILDCQYNRSRKVGTNDDKIRYINILYSQVSFYKTIYDLMDAIESNTEYTMFSITEQLFKEIVSKMLIQL